MHKIKEIDGKNYIFDSIRKKYLLLTPEEWVRQHFIEFLIQKHQYPKSLIKLEGGLKYHFMSKRSDILVFDRQGHPFFLIECKAESIKLSMEVLDQVSRYNQTIRAPYIGVTNGTNSIIYHINHVTQVITEISTIPTLP